MKKIDFSRPGFWLALLLVSALILGCTSMEEKRDNYIKQGKQLFEKKDYKRARLQFKNALQIDPKSAEAYLWVGKTELRRKKFKAAFGALSKAAELKPDLIEAQIMLGQLFLLARRLDDAKAKLDLVLSKEPENPEALLLAASMAIVQKEPEKAMGYLKKVRHLDPHKTTVYLLQSAIEAKENPEAAAAPLEDGIKANPKALELYLARAQLADSQKQFDQAEAALLKATELEPKNLKLQDLLARHYARAGKWDKVEGVLRHKLTLEPDKVDPVKELARFLLQRGQWKDAEQTIKNFMAQKPDNFDIRFALADFYFTLKQDGKGIKVLQEIIDKAPHGPKGIEAKDKLAARRLVSGRIEEAEKLIGEVLKDNPKDVTAIGLQGRLALFHKDGLKAVTNFRQLTKDNPKDPKAWLLLARAHLLNKEPEQAKEKARKAIEIKPDFWEARKFLYGLFLNAKDYNGAIQAIKGYLSYNDKDVFNINALGDVNVLKHDYGQARDCYQKIVTLEPKNPLGYFKLGLLSRQQKKTDQALKYFEKALKEKPTFIPALQQEIIIYLEQKQPEKALGAVQANLAQNPKNPPALLILGELFLSQRRPREAIGPLEKAMAYSPNPAVLRLLAFAYQKLPDQEQVTQQLEEKISDPKTLPFNFLVLSSLYEHQHKFEKARKVYETLLQRDIFTSLASNNLAYLLAEHDPTPANLKKAEQLVKNALDDNPEEPSFLDTMGWILCKQGKLAQAKVALEKAEDMNPKNPSILYHLGWCTAKSGDTAEARKTLEKALELKKPFPEQAEAKKLLDTLPPAPKP